MHSNPSQSIIVGFKMLDEAIAWNLDSHVMGSSLLDKRAALNLHIGPIGGYEFLMQNCTLPDSLVAYADLTPPIT